MIAEWVERHGARWHHNPDGSYSLVVRITATAKELTAPLGMSILVVARAFTELLGKG